MTSKVMPSIIQIEKENLKQLLTEVKETIAPQSSEIKNKKFGITDMWNSQKNMRTALSRRRYYSKTF